MKKWNADDTDASNADKNGTRISRMQATRMNADKNK
jgi:hypothetical protein